MKKILMAAITALCFSSCDVKTSVSSDNSEARQKNIDANNVVIKAFETGDTSGIDNVISPDFIDHTDRGDFKGSDSLKGMVKFVKENMKDMKSEKLHEFADDDYVFTWMRWRGNSNGAGGMPNGPFDMKAIEVTKFKDGKAVEHWTYMDTQEMMKMMAGMNNMNHADTTKSK